MSRSTRSITAGIAAFAALAPAAAAMPQDGPLSTSGTKPAARHGDSIRTSSLAGTSARQDLRSPDARDAAAANVVLRKHPLNPPASPPATPPTHLVRVVASDGFDWSDAVIGAGGAFGALVLVAGSGVALRRRVRHSLAS